MDLEHLYAAAASHHCLVSSADLALAGVTPSLRRTLVSSGELRRISRTSWLVLPGLQAEVPVLARVTAAVRDQGPDAYAMLSAAARLLGIRGLPRELEVVDVGLPPGRSRHAPASTSPIGRVRLHVPVIDPLDVTEACGVRCTTPIRTIGDLLLTLTREDAVSMLDAELHGGRLTREALEVVTGSLQGRKGCRQARLWAALTDGRAESPLETRVRLCAYDAGFPPEELQWPMFDAYGNRIAIADLAWPSRRLLVEADGLAYHSGGPRRRYDRRRQNAIVAADGRWQVLRFDWSDCLTRGYVATALRDVLDAGHL